MTLPTSGDRPDLPDDAALAVLRSSTIEPVGVLTEASNLTLLVDLHDAHGPTGHRGVYKPVRGERPLRDFPPGTLAAREAASYLVSREGGWDLVPPTVLRDGPLGPGSLQWWVDQEPERLADPSDGLVEVLDAETFTGTDPETGLTWLPVMTGETEDGGSVVVVHADDPDLRGMAVLDVVLNNADRKGAHLTRDLGGRLRGFDHGLCLHVEDKLRTVLWGWVGDPLPIREQERLHLLDEALADPGSALASALGPLLTEAERQALAQRVTGLLATGLHPDPPEDRYPLPWPLW